MKPSASSEPVSGRAGPALLVAQTSFLGDVVLTTPLLAELRTSLRPRRLAVLVRPEAAPLLAGHPAVDDVLIDDKRGRDRGLRGLARVARRLRRERFDLAVSPHRSLRTALLLTAARIPCRVGLRESRGALPYHTPVPRHRPRPRLHRHLGVPRPVGAPPP